MTIAKYVRTCIAIICIGFVAAVWGCSKSQSPKPQPASAEVPVADVPVSTSDADEPAPSAETADPSSVYCTENKGKLLIEDGKDGSFGVCVFEDGSRCEAWRYFRQECTPATCFDKTGTCEK